MSGSDYTDSFDGGQATTDFEDEGETAEGYGEEATGEPSGEPAFDFSEQGLLVSAEDSPVPSEDEPLKVSFSVCNSGAAAGTAEVTLTIDGVDTGILWTSGILQPGECASPDDGYIHDVPGQADGRHLFEVWASPAGPAGGTASNEVDI